MNRWLPLTAMFFLVGCEAPAERPAAPPEATPAPAPSAAPARVGPPAYVGRWAADPRACTDPSGDLQPIEITADRFEGYENSCAITAITATGEPGASYDASLSCEAEGMTRRETVNMRVEDDRLTLVYADRNAAPVQLVRCKASPAEAAREG
jgi:hypothetical protein